MDDDIPPFQAAERHVVISAVDRYPHGLEHLLSVTKSMSMTDDTHISALDDLSDMDKLEECMLRRCHQMVNVFVKPYMRRTLRNASVSHLKSLTHYFYRPLGGGVEFDALKHLRLEHCPRLVGVMPRGSALPNLVTLDILFCDNLKAVFYDNGPYSSRYWYELPCLRRMRLQELPQLQHLRDDHNAAILTAPAWEELHVRGCWSLRRLPRLRQRSKQSVEVSGERDWWANLRWDRDGSILHRGGYQPVLPPASASFRDRVVIKSYLR
ncbi:hypothetical protein PR202_gb15799 [Eleusine coracana subsp. coracana]|uniref:Disease resistance protein At4g27190-like leucine-rich repeats domain-containing protein n=1 Tax=Eleusine coracana subsp. coracana TaxID=191504 RepID=A0AAV5F0G0_ELECO|nr:hypothetical protein PR202_gb15799 [Eleusine coracana subsp. coracana]